MNANLAVMAVALVVRNGKALLLRRKIPATGEELWSFTCGTPVAGESLTACALRRLTEETGIVARKRDIICRSIIQHRDERAERVYFAVHIEDFS